MAIQVESFEPQLQVGRKGRYDWKLWSAGVQETGRSGVWELGPEDYVGIDRDQMLANVRTHAWRHGLLVKAQKLPVGRIRFQFVLKEDA